MKGPKHLQDKIKEPKRSREKRSDIDTSYLRYRMLKIGIPGKDHQNIKTEKEIIMGITEDSFS